MAHAHGSGHADWEVLGRTPLLRGLLIVLGGVALTTVVGAVALWPDGTGRDAAREQAATIGLASERLIARVESVTDAPCSYQTEDDSPCRSIVVIPEEGPEAGALVALGEFSVNQPRFSPEVAVGDTIVVGYEPSTNTYFYADQDRRLSLAWLAVVFAVVVVALARLRGMLALIAMGLTLVVLLAFVAPSVLDGNDPLLVSVVAASMIAFIALLLTHGVNPSTVVALSGTLAALGLTLLVSWLFFRAAGFTGLATEEGITLPFVAGGVNLSSLLLGGAVLGALGALDDVTVTQVVTIQELRAQNPTLNARKLTAAGIRVGREHIAATVNTLLLAYVGASMPLLLLFAVTNQSLVQVANSELIAVEIFRTLCGSIGLVAAVPITTALAAVVATSGPRVAPRPRRAKPRSDPQPSRPAPPTWQDFGPRDDLEL
jgi:uncharacterized membrane protein